MSRGTHAGRLANLTNMGKGRPKGSKDKITKAHKELAMVIAKSVIMEKKELLERLSEQARSDIGKHLTITKDGAEVALNPEHTDILREVTVRSGGGVEEPWTETKIKVADPVPALRELADIYGMKKSTEAGKRIPVLIQILNQVGIDPEKSLKAFDEVLALEE